MKKMIPIGVSEFQKIREENYYYVDKTNLIVELLNKGTEVTLFTRPRRFGKTLNMTMLREFFDITKDNKHLFIGLEVEKHDCFQEINTYPTLFFSFRECKGEKEYLIKSVKWTLFSEFEKYYFLRDTLNDLKKSSFDEIVEHLRTSNLDDLSFVAGSIKFLAAILYEYYQKPVMLIIDEYDTPMVEAYIEGCYGELRSFFSTLYASALKDNPYLAKGILTGIQRVAKENIFSGLNNLDVVTVLDSEYNQYFGLTVKETSEILEYCGLELTEEVTWMYNGYNFGGEQIYNPWSITNYASKKKLKPYWVNTSTNALIRRLIREAETSFFEAFELLIANQEVETVIDTRTSFWEVTSTETLWGLLINAGYITVKDPEFSFTNTIAIPNREIKTEFQELVSEYTKIGKSPLLMMFKFLVYDGNIEKFKKVYQDIVLRNTSYYDAKENAYHMLFLGMCVYLDNDYDIKSNIETGEGRSDIVLTSFNPDRYPNLIIEFKQGENVGELAQVALEQIKGKQYAANMKGRTVLMGVAHNKKQCEILSEEVGVL